MNVTLTPTNDNHTIILSIDIKRNVLLNNY